MALNKRTPAANNGDGGRDSQASTSSRYGSPHAPQSLGRRRLQPLTAWPRPLEIQAIGCTPSTVGGFLWHAATRGGPKTREHSKPVRRRLRGQLRISTVVRLPSGQVWSSSAQICGCGPFHARAWAKSVELGSIRLKLRRTWAKFGRFRGELAGSCRNNPQVWGPNAIDLDRCRPHFGQTRSGFGKTWATPIVVGPMEPRLGPQSTNCAGHAVPLYGRRCCR